MLPSPLRVFPNRGRARPGQKASLPSNQKASLWFGERVGAEHFHASPIRACRGPENATAGVIGERRDAPPPASGPVATGRALGRARESWRTLSEPGGRCPRCACSEVAQHAADRPRGCPKESGTALFHVRTVGARNWLQKIRAGWLHSRKPSADRRSRVFCTTPGETPTTRITGTENPPVPVSRSR